MRLSEVLAGVGGIALLAAIVFPVFAQAKNCPHCHVALSNVKQLGLGTIVYADDHDDRLPPRDAWMDASFPYTKNWSLYHCPLMPSGAWGYAFNGALGGAKWQERATTVPMLYDSANPAKNASDLVTSLPRPGRHGGKNDVVYEDGHVKRVAP